MPIIKVQLLAGHTPGVKTRLANMLTDACRMVIDAPHEAITVTLQEFEPENFMRGGAREQRAPALTDPISLVNAYDQAFFNGDFNAAEALLTDDFIYYLPDGVELTSARELAIWLSGRSRQVNVTRRTFETAVGDRGPVVYLRYRLSGTRVDGVAYENVRVAERFEFVKDKISSIELWSDFIPAPEQPLPQT